MLREVGRTGRAHGTRGDVYVDLLTDRLERLAVGARLRVGERWLTVMSARPAGSRWLVHFTECGDRSTAEGLANSTIFAEPLPEATDGVYVHQLIGAQVVGQNGHPYGRCVAVVANPAHDLLELADGALVPAVFITAVSEGQVVIDPPEGLLDPEE